jgi:hypothetical protein
MIQVSRAAPSRNFGLEVPLEKLNILKKVERVVDKGDNLRDT